MVLLREIYLSKPDILTINQLIAVAWPYNFFFTWTENILTLPKNIFISYVAFNHHIKFSTPFAHMHVFKVTSYQPEPLGSPWMITA